MTRLSPIRILRLRLSVERYEFTGDGEYLSADSYIF